MKKLLAVLLAAVLMLALAVPAFALIYYNDLGIFRPNTKSRTLIKETYVYDDEEYFSDYSEGTWDGYKYSGYEYEYTDYENGMRTYRERLDGEWKDFDAWVYRYDEQGKIIGEYKYVYDANGDKTIEYRYDYKEFDSDGNVTKYEVYSEDGKGGFYKEAEKEKEYSGGQLITRKGTLYLENGNFDYSYVDDYAYDGDNLVMERSSYYNTEGAQYPDEIYECEYEYDEDGNCTDYKFSMDGDYTTRTTYEYDSKGRVTEIHNFYFREDTWLEEDCYYEISYEETADGYIAITEAVYDQGFDAKVELEEEELSEETSIEAKNATAGRRENINKDVITLDKYGDIVKKKEFVWDPDMGQSGDWKAYQTATFVYEDVEEKPERSENPIIIDGKYDDEPTNEVNPNTGAPVMSVAFATVVCGAALIICKKHK